MTARAAWLLASMLAVACAAAAEPAPDVTSDSLEAVGDVRFDGRLAALQLAGPAGGDATLALDRAKAETDYVERLLVAGSAPLPDDPQRAHVNLTAALLEGSGRAGQALFLVPLAPGSANVTVAAQRLDLEPSGPASVAQARMVLGRAPWQADVADTIAVGAAERVDLTVTGDFGLVLWDWPLQGGGASFPSGAESTAVGPSGPVRTAEREVARQVYLVVHGATLSLRQVELGADALFVAEASMAVQGYVAFHGAVGSVPVGAQDVPLEGDSVVSGDLLVVSSADDRLRSQVGGSPSAVVGAGEAFRGGAGAGGLGLPALLALALALACAALVAYAAASRRVAASLEADLQAKAYGSVVRKWWFLRPRARREEVAVPAVIASLRMGRPKAARRAYRRWGGRDGAVGRYLHGCVLALEGRHDEARSQLKACLALAPGMLYEIESNPLLASLLAKRPAHDGSYA